MTNKIIKDLSIQVNLNGLSFCILDSNARTILHINAIKFEEKLTPFETLNRLKKELSTNIIFSDNFKNITVIHKNDLATLVPQPYYNEVNNADYLKYNTKILKTDFIASDNIKAHKIVCVYVPYVNINNYLFDAFGTFTYKHAATVLINAINNIEINSEDNYIFVNIENNTMQVVIKQNNKLQLYNCFDFASSDDFIYYLLFTCEQKQLNPELIKLKLLGTISENDEIYKIAYKYVRHVEVLKNSNHFILKNSF